MASNALPRQTGDLTKLANNMATGLKLLGATLDIKQVTAAELEAQVAVVGTTQTAFNEARGVLQTAVSAATTATAAIEAWLFKARAVLVPYLGDAWSAEWAAAGFTAISTAVPRTVGERFKLVGLLATYFTQYPGYENADPKVNVTAAEAKRLAGASKAADDAVAPVDAAANAKKKEREAAEEALRGTMRVLIGILSDKLAPDDSRWADFGLWQPAANSSPAVPINVTATIVEGPAVLCECDAVQRATRYRWRTRLVGAPDFTLAASTADPMAQIANVVPGQTIEIIVQAVNGSAQGLPSGPVTVRIPATESAPKAREAASSSTDENGATSAPKTNRSHANGNGAHALV